VSSRDCLRRAIPFLTTGADSNYPGNQAMKNHHRQRGNNRRPAWAVFLCVLLAALFFYNPFVALSSPAGDLAVHSLARNRSTVGASELQQFSPQQSLGLQPELFFLGLVAALRPVQHTWRPAHFVEARIAPLAKLPSNLRFRPPPAV
jgi:hypothetical protein